MKKPNTPVTVTVRPDGSYYVERPAAPQLKRVQVKPESARGGLVASVRSTLLEAGGIAAVVKTVAPNLGPYGTLAALGFGVLRALATPEPPPKFKLRRIAVPKGR